MKKVTLVTIAFVLFVAFFSCKSEEKKEVKQQTAKEPEEKSKNTKLAKFNLKPIKPVNGTLKGVVELGASGFNCFIINVDKDQNWEVKKKVFGTSLIAEGMTNTAEVNAKLRDYIQKIVEFGVSPKAIHFVVSSGAAKENITKLISKELKNIGYVVNTVTPEQEGEYALKSALPNRFKNTAFVVDIGSGNTKISYIKKNDSVVALESHGAKYFQKKTEDSKVYTDVKAVVAKVPSGKTLQCFIIGGVPYKLAKSVRNGKERYTVLSTNAEDFAKVTKEEGEKVKCGLNIYKAVIEQTGVKKVIFDWDANFTIGFLLDLE